MDRYWDVVGRNAALAVLHAAVDAERMSASIPPRNVVRFVLTNDEWRRMTEDWERVARLAVAGLRTSLASLVAANPDDQRAAALVTDLTRNSAKFREWWPAHEVWASDSPLTRMITHPVLGRIEIETTMLDVRSAPGLTLVIESPCEPRVAEELKRLVPR